MTPQHGPASTPPAPTAAGPRTRDPRTHGLRRRAAGRFVLGLLIVAPPLLLALLGPLFAGDPGERGISFDTGGGHWLGTDFVGRDVGRQVLLGGRSVVLVALSATALTYAVALPVGLTAALTHRGWLEEALMRPLDVLLAVPSLLLLLLVAAAYRPGTGGLVLLVALVNLPDAARMVRAAAAEAASRPAVEALRMQGESWWRIAVGYVGRATRRTLVADAGVRLTGVLYLVATAAFLGVGVEPDAADWAVMVDRNRTGLSLQPWAVVLPALLIVALSMGTNLLFDAALGPRTRPTRGGSGARRRGRSAPERQTGRASAAGDGLAGAEGHLPAPERRRGDLERPARAAAPQAAPEAAPEQEEHA